MARSPSRSPIPSARRKTPVAAAPAKSGRSTGSGPDAASLQDRRDADEIQAGVARWKRAGRKSKSLADVAKDLGIKP